jgi:DNA-directed RNA polymerase subunit RPC12/RpoP
MHMGLFDSVTGLFGGTDTRYAYMCDKCETAFESEKADMSTVSCPECRSTKIRAQSE